MYVLIQYSKNESAENLHLAGEVVTCIDQGVIRLIDLRAPLDELKHNDIEKYKDLFQGHMTKEGNAFVASILQDAIRATR